MKSSVHSFPTRETSQARPRRRGVHLSIPVSPFIIAKIFIGKLFQKGPFYYPFGCFILEKVDKHMLQSRITVRSGGLFGKQVEPGVFFMECLVKTELESRLHCGLLHTQVDV